MIQYVLPKISCKQVYNCFKLTVLPNSKSVLKSTPVVVQSTTTKRSCIILVQKFCSFKCYNSALDHLQNMNKVLCNLMGKTFGEVIQNSVYGGDKTWFQACGNGKAGVFGSHVKKKHENKDSNSWVSNKMHCTGYIAGWNVPTIFFLKGKSRFHHFTDKWLMDDGE